MLDKNILRDILPFKQRLIMVILATVIQAIIIVLISNSIAAIMNDLLLASITVTAAIPLLVLLLFLFVSRAGINYFNRLTMEKISLQFQSLIRYRLCEILACNKQNIEKSQGQWLALITKGVDKLDIYITQFLPQFFILASFPIVFVVVSFYKDWISAIVFLITAPLIPVFMILIGKIADSENKKQWKYFQYLSNYLADLLPGLLIIKAYNQAENQLLELEKRGEEFSKSTLKVLKVAFISAFMLEFISTLSIAIVAVNIGLRLLYQEGSFEPLFFILLLAPQFYQPFRQFGASFHEAMNGIVASSEIYSLLNNDVFLGKYSFNSKIPQGDISVEFKNIGFSYGDKVVFEDLNLKIEKGTFTALIGPNGIGKSTIFKLLTKNILPDTGSIFINDIDIKDMDCSSFIGYVPQHPYIFNNSIRENITMGRDISDSDINYWVNRLQLQDKIAQITSGYDAILDEQNKLSAGQIRRLGMVRALVGKPKLLLLDEPLENLDIQNERQIREILHELKGKMTIIIIAHRQDTLDIADDILNLGQ